MRFLVFFPFIPHLGLCLGFFWKFFDFFHFAHLWWIFTEGCCVRIDDILVSGGTDEIHLENLHRVLQRLQECGLKLNPSKFRFMLDQVVYLGTTISAEGISPTKERVKAIRQAEAPTNAPELQSFLGSFNFLRKFVPDFARTSYFVRKHAENGETGTRSFP